MNEAALALAMERCSDCDHRKGFCCMASEPVMCGMGSVAPSIREVNVCPRGRSVPKFKVIE